jgi:hypothetical protein
MFFAAFAYRQRTAAHPLVTPSLMKNRGFTSGLQVCLVAVAAGAGLLFELSLFLQEGLHISPKDTSLALLPLTPGLVAAGFAAMGGLAAKPGRRLVFTGLTVDLVGCGCVLASPSPASRSPPRCPVRRHQNPTSEQPARLSSMAGTVRPCPASRA